MADYDFDIPVDRHGTDSLKFDYAEALHRSPDLLSLWVADMDFPAPTEVVEALERRVRHGVFGYTEPGGAYYQALADWMGTRYGLVVKPDEVIATPGVVFALAVCVRAFTKPGEAVLIQRPVYYPFTGVVESNGRKLVNAPLTYRDGIYSIDFEAFEHTVEESNAKLFLLCNPHNPVGRVWTQDELIRLGAICADHGIIVVSDEIHMDFARPGYTHIPFASLSPELAQIAITCTSASKTFNLAGLQVANTIIPNEELRRMFATEIQSEGYSEPNALGITATYAAYSQGGEWLAQLKDYLEGNWQLLENHLSEHAPYLHLVPAQSTYLAWVDCHALGLDDRELERFVEDEAGLWLDCGYMFGPEGSGFIRVNIATQRAYLAQALDQLASALGRRI